MARVRKPSGQAVARWGSRSASGNTAVEAGSATGENRVTKCKITTNHTVLAGAAPLQGNEAPHELTNQGEFGLCLNLHDHFPSNMGSKPPIDFGAALQTASPNETRPPQISLPHNRTVQLSI